MPIFTGGERRRGIGETTQGSPRLGPQSLITHLPEITRTPARRRRAAHRTAVVRLPRARGHVSAPPVRSGPRPGDSPGPRDRYRAPGARGRPMRSTDRRHRPESGCPPLRPIARPSRASGRRVRADGPGARSHTFRPDPRQPPVPRDPARRAGDGPLAEARARRRPGRLPRHGSYRPGAARAPRPRGARVPAGVVRSEPAIRSSGSAPVGSIGEAR